MVVGDSLDLPQQHLLQSLYAGEFQVRTRLTLIIDPLAKEISALFLCAKAFLKHKLIEEASGSLNSVSPAEISR